MSDWTKEPWPTWEDTWGLSSADYARARACVNSLSGRVPERLEALEEAIGELLSYDPAVDWPFLHDAWDGLKAALAAFRGETT